MSGLNKCMLIGRLGEDPEIKTLDNGTKMASFSMATSETYKDKSGQKVEKTEWHNIVFWKQLADIAERFLNKGDLVYVEGKIETRKYTDKDGNDKYMTQIIGFSMTMLGGKSDGGNKAPQGKPKQETGQTPSTAEDEDSGLPF